jgi:hypothetical protein
VQVAGVVLLDAELQRMGPFATAALPSGSGVALKSRLRAYSCRGLAMEGSGQFAVSKVGGAAEAVVQKL